MSRVVELARFVNQPVTRDANHLLGLRREEAVRVARPSSDLKRKSFDGAKFHNATWPSLTMFGAYGRMKVPLALSSRPMPPRRTFRIQPKNPADFREGDIEQLRVALAGELPRTYAVVATEPPAQLGRGVTYYEIVQMWLQLEPDAKDLAKHLTMKAVDKAAGVFIAWVRAKRKKRTEGDDPLTRSYSAHMTKYSKQSSWTVTARSSTRQPKKFKCVSATSFHHLRRHRQIHLRLGTRRPRRSVISGVEFDVFRPCNLI
jgi:hypothetical protein